MEVTLTDISPEVQRAKQRFGIAGNSAVLIAAIQRAVQVAPIDLSVLVTGESGTGKEFFPQIIHAYSARKHSRYIAVNCGAIPEGTIDSELFGHEKGAFTGAVASRKGYFEEADGGTIFLDEVAELPLTTQARLLRVLESGEFIRVGSSEVQKTNIRVVAATNVDMLKAVAEGKFREDLYYRLSTVMISVPPLRDRGNDVALLARKFSADFAERYRMPQITFDDTARRLLMQYRWPGNVRQLKNVVEQAALFEAGRTLSSSDLEPYLPSSSAVYTPAVTEAHHNYGHERDMLFNMIFRLQSELDSLRREVDHLRTSAPATPPLVEAIEAPAVETETAIVAPAVAQPTSTHLVPYSSTTAIAAMQPHSAPQVATLEETEKETIRRSLRKNDGRRKATAKELNISERTLYRKIKEYGLDD
ncbi:MAG: sigma-54-dependent Fis family transcriptional regulator [Bacteroides sp.]|nr:sigma-54-dependent Fis family transcriptional regulator [Bacteroides sp.]MDE6248486.1 sigma-54 dependent transcriptional regulator [Paramuribaculum sp.]